MKSQIADRNRDTWSAHYWARCDEPWPSRRIGRHTYL